MSRLQDLVERVADLTGLTTGVLLVMAGIYAGLIVGTIARLSHLGALPPEKAASLRVRLRTWWIIAIVVTVAVLLTPVATVALVAFVSVLALREYLAMVPERARYGRIVILAYASIPLQYLWIYLGWYELSIVFVPVIMFLLLTLTIVLSRSPAGFVHTVGTLQWGMMLLVFCLSHVAFLLALPAELNPAGGAVGWFVYLVLLTEFNDIAQALFGRPFGRHKIIPRLSPGKSWEGLIGAVACTVVLAVLLAPVLTPLGETPPGFAGDAARPFYLSPWSALAGLLIGIGGFFGDITISAVKRDAHVKDSGSLLPGQGGILDRIDSLTFTAPLFFHYVHLLYF